MRYRLRTLLVAAAVGPPLLALAWFAAIWARYALPPVMVQVMTPIALLSIVGVVALCAVIVAWPPPGSPPAATISPTHLVMLAGLTLAGLWHWLWGLGGLIGFLFLWGDNSPSPPQ